MRREKVGSIFRSFHDSSRLSASPVTLTTRSRCLLFPKQQDVERSCRPTGNFTRSTRLSRFYQVRKVHVFERRKRCPRQFVSNISWPSDNYQLKLIYQSIYLRFLLPAIFQKFLGHFSLIQFFIDESFWFFVQFSTVVQPVCRGKSEFRVGPNFRAI